MSYDVTHMSIVKLGCDAPDCEVRESQTAIAGVTADEASALEWKNAWYTLAIDASKGSQYSYLLCSKRCGWSVLEDYFMTAKA